MDSNSSKTKKKKSWTSPLVKKICYCFIIAFACIASFSCLSLSSIIWQARIPSSSQRTPGLFHRTEISRKVTSDPPRTYDINIWLKQENFTCLDPKLSKSTLLCCFKRMRQKMPLSLTKLDSVLLLHSNCSRYLTQSLPERKPQMFNSCAVVSSGPSMLKFKLGKEIDSHDAIFRINMAPTKSFEKYVGSKTTIRVLNSKILKHPSSYLKLVKTDRQLNNKSRLLYFVREMTPPNLPKAQNACLVMDRLLTGYMKFQKEAKTVEAHVNHPLFSRFCLAELMFRLKAPGRKRGLSFSSGTFAVLSAIWLCEYVTSYEIASNDPLSKNSSYYFDGKGKAYSAFHPLPAERSVLEKLGTRRKGTSIYEFDLRQPCD
eukprot:m.18701 g.18701  ORF g.18701 m.18701 type:complete len:373 (+) comp27717_c0_seq1:166-1284(+)